MSKLMVEVCEVEKVEKWPNSDNLMGVTIKGWKCCTNNKQIKEKDKVLYIPVDSLVGLEIARKWDLHKYLATLPQKHDLFGKYGRVRAASIRGTPSFGFIISEIDQNLEIGTDLSDVYDLKKYEPIPPQIQAKACRAPDVPWFYKYTDIENWKNHNKEFTSHETVVITCKLHGSNSRIAYLRIKDSEDYELTVGTHYNRLKRIEEEDKDPLTNWYWYPVYYHPQIEEMLKFIKEQYGAISVILYGETYGGSVQGGYNYGIERNELSYAAFDIQVDGKYLDFTDFQWYCNYYDIPTVPVLYVGKFSEEVLDRLTNQERFFYEKPLREGVVIRSFKEGISTGKLQKYNGGRRILKNISNDYWLAKHKTEHH